MSLLKDQWKKQYQEETSSLRWWDIKRKLKKVCIQGRIEQDLFIDDNNKSHQFERNADSSGYEKIYLK